MILIACLCFISSALNFCFRVPHAYYTAHCYKNLRDFFTYCTVRKDFAPSEHCLYWPVISLLLLAENFFVISHFCCEDENRPL
jgi:hypothetical protein